MRKIGEVRSLHHRLILMVGPAGTGKTSALQVVSASTSVPLVNVVLDLSRRMLDLTEHGRALQLPRLLGEIVGEATGDLPAATCLRAMHRQAPAAQAGLVLLDNFEILFDVYLKQDPLRLLQGLSRNKTVPAAWNGEVGAEGRALWTESPPDIDSALSTQSSALYSTCAAPDPPRIPPAPDLRFFWWPVPW
ncbi:MAG: hypothetical protein Kow0059_20620 [Candidatus Sumerlaeia bacterium]